MVPLQCSITLCFKRFDGEDVFGNKITIREKAFNLTEDEDGLRRKRVTPVLFYLYLQSNS